MNSTPESRLLEVITPLVPPPVLQGTEQALAIAGESLVPIFRVAYKARDHRIDCVWKWLQPFVAVCEANPELEPFRRPTFLALLNCHNFNVDLPIVVTADQLIEPKTVDTLSTMVDIAPPSNEGAAA